MQLSRTRSWWGVALVAALALTACNRTPAPDANSGAASDTAAPANASGNATAAIDPVDVELEIGSIDEYNAILQKHAGQVVLVDFWATWCGPCVEGFPKTVALAKKYRDRGLATVAVSLDDPTDEETLEGVKQFLASNGADFPNLVSKDGASTESMEAFGLNAAVPHYRLYDREGKLVQSWDGLPDDLEAQIEALLAQES